MPQPSPCHVSASRDSAPIAGRTNSFVDIVANNFWGKDDAGVGPLLERMVNSKQTCDELKSFYGGEDIRPHPRLVKSIANLMMIQHELQSKMSTPESCLTLARNP